MKSGQSDREGQRLSGWSSKLNKIYDKKLNSFCPIDAFTVRTAGRDRYILKLNRHLGYTVHLLTNIKTVHMLTNIKSFRNVFHNLQHRPIN